MRRSRGDGDNGMDLGDIAWGGVDWMLLGEDSYQSRSVVNTVVNILVR
jgi:hypothetical protein